MKITGGNFGLDGKATIKNGKLRIDGLSNSSYEPGQIDSAYPREERNKRLGLFSLVLGVLVVGGGLFVLAGPVGFVVGVLLAVAGSFYSTKKLFIDIAFKDGNKLTIESSKPQARRFFSFCEG